MCPDDTIKLIAYNDTSVNLTFVVPTQYDDPSSGVTVDVNYVEVTSISGMPVGLNWECNNMPDCHYDGGSMGCALVCGTPISPPGVYVATVNLDANVSVVGNTTTSFDLVFEILPANSNNFAFGYSPTQGCLPLTVNFTNNIPSNGSPDYSYSWDFGNGYQSSLENPSPQTYDTAGDYIISYQVQIDTAQYFFSEVTVLGASCDDVGSDQDFYYVLKLNGNAIYTSQTIDNDAPPTDIPTLNQTLLDTTYVLEIWDEDGGLAGGDDFCGDVSFNGHNDDTLTLTNGSLTVKVIIQHPVVTITESDTISVFDNPPIPFVNFQPNDSVCDGNFVELTSSSQSNNQWFNENGIIPQADSSVYLATTSGSYFVRVTNLDGCFSDSPIDTITILDNPFKPTFWINYDTLTSNSTYPLQWYFYNDTVGIPLQNETSNQLVVNQSGYYFVVATNEYGCTSSSDTVYITSYNINDNNLNLNVNIYPNPAHDMVNIDFTNTQKINKIVILNSLSQIVSEVNIDENNLNIKKVINLENTKKGVYFIKFSSNYNIFTKKLVIN